MSSKLIIFVILVAAHSIKHFCNSQTVGEKCTIERNDHSGICKLIMDCPAVIDDIRKQRQHTRCGFEGRREIVCCPTSVSMTTKTTQRPLVSIVNKNSRISEKKCAEYSSAVYEDAYSLSIGFDHERVKTKVDKCGHTVIPLIVGGQFAKPREFPHMALIGFDSINGVSWGCGGTLISDQYVLTAGHCLLTGMGSPKYVRLGDLNIQNTNEESRPENYNVAEVIPHPQYKRRYKYNDIGLIKLDRIIDLDPFKRPACLPTSFNIQENKAIATGWGDTQWSGTSSSHLLKVTLERFSHKECNNSYASQIDRRFQFGVVDNIQFCAGSRNERRDTCQGDSGGPLQVYHKNLYCMYTIIGITSFGILCGEPGTPGIYTRVYSYINWIESVVWN